VKRWKRSFEERQDIWVRWRSSGKWLRSVVQRILPTISAVPGNLASLRSFGLQVIRRWMPARYGDAARQSRMTWPRLVAIAAALGFPNLASFILSQFALRRQTSRGKKPQCSNPARADPCRGARRASAQLASLPRPFRQSSRSYEEEDRGSNHQYHPGMMTEDLLYGYAVGVFSLSPDSRNVWWKTWHSECWQPQSRQISDHIGFRKLPFESAGKNYSSRVLGLGVRGGRADSWELVALMGAK